MRTGLKLLLGVAGVAVATQVAAQATLYEGNGYVGRFVTADSAMPDLGLYQLNGRVASANISSGRWEACSSPGFQGQCVILEPGSYPTLASMQMGLGVSSVRPLAAARVGYQAPAAVVTTIQTPTVVQTPTIVQTPTVVATAVNPADQILDARVISVRPIAGATGQHCWMEQKQVGPVELPGVLLNGMGDLLTGKPQATQYVQRCESVPTTTAFDVTYEFQGIERHVQLSAAPGPTIAVNGYGQPRG